MRKILLAAIFLLSTVVLSCNKKDDPIDQPLSENSWRIGSTIYKTRVCHRHLYEQGSIAFEDTVTNSGMCQLYFLFPAIPVTSGTYKVTGKDTPAAGEVRVTAITSSNGLDNYYMFSDPTGVTVTVTVNGGKIHLSIPETEINKGTSSDKVKFAVLAGEL